MNKPTDYLLVRVVKLFIAQTFIKTTPSRVFLAVLFGLRLLVVFGVFVWTGGDQDVVIIQQHVILFVLWTCLVYSIILILSTMYMLIKIHTRIKRSKRNQSQTYFYKIIQKLTIYLLLVYKLFLSIPMMFVSFVALKMRSMTIEGQAESDSMIDGLAIVNLILGLVVIYPICGLGFWNKMGIRQNSLAYCTVVNIESLIYLFIPVLITVRVYQWQIQSYLGIVFTIIQLITLYIYPLVSFNHNKLHTLASSGVVSVMCVCSFSLLIDGGVDTFGRYVAVLLCIGVAMVGMWQTQIYRVRKLLTIRINNKNTPTSNNKNNNNNIIQQNTQQQQFHNNISWIDKQSYYENLLYNLINWQQNQNQLMLYVISSLKYQQTKNVSSYDQKQFMMVKQSKLIQKKQSNIGLRMKWQNINVNNNVNINNVIRNNNDYGLIEKNLSTLLPNNNNNEKLINKQQPFNNKNTIIPQSATSQILYTLTNKQISSQKLYHLFIKLISQRLNARCNLQQIDKQKLGARELLKVLQQNMGYFILLLQSLMLESNNFTKTYLLIKLQQQLLHQAQQSSQFMQSIYAYAIIQVIQNYFLLQFKTNTNQLSPAHNYFMFQQKYQKLKHYIKQSAQNKLMFWQQTNKQQPLEDKLIQYITNNYIYQMKILKSTQRITNTYNNSPLILLSLIQSYTQLALNNNLSSTKNIFNFLALQFHKLYNDSRNKLFFSQHNKDSQYINNQSNIISKEQSKFISRSNKSTTIIMKHNNNNKLENIYTELQHSPSSHSQKNPSSIMEFNNGYEENISKYAIQKCIGVFLINLQSHSYPIEWANQYFYQKFTHFFINNHQNSQQQQENRNNKQNQKRKQIVLNDILVPQLRSTHDKYVHKFIHQGTSLVYQHNQTQFYFADDQTFLNVNMEFQFFPSLTNGLKIMGFVHPVKGIKKDPIQIILRSDLTFVACTKSFMDRYQQFSLIKDQLNFQKDKALAFDIIMQNNIFGDFFTNVRMKQSGYRKKKETQQQQQQKHTQFKDIKDQEQQQQQDIESRTTHMGMDYKVRLKQKLQYEGKERDGMKDNQNNVTKYLFVFQLNVEEVINNNQQDIVDDKQSISLQVKKTQTKKGSLQMLAENSLLDQSPRSSKGSQSTFFKGPQTSRSGRLQSKKTDIDQKDDMIIEEDILIKERQKIQDKPQQIINLQRCYEILVSQKTPKNVKRWRLFTVIILILLKTAMICNMGFLSQRQSLYDSNNQIATNYSSLISDISETVAALREYNFYVYTYSTDRPQIPFIVNQLVSLSDTISNKVKLIASVLKKVWMAYQMLPNGSTSVVYDTSYVVVSNYILSAVTFQSQLPSYNLSFPLLIGERYAYGQPPTPAQISFIQAVFNGLYVAIVNLLDDRRQFIDTMANNLLSTSSMYFIYICISGSFCLLLFLIFSLILELNSQRIRSQTGGLLSSQFLSGQQRIRKIENLQKLKEILQNSKESNKIPDLTNQKQKYEYLDVLVKTLKDIDYGNVNDHLKQNRKDDNVLSAMINKEHIIDDKTNRQFMDNEESVRSSEVSSADGQQMSQQHTQKGMKKGDLDTMQKFNVKQKSKVNLNINEKRFNIMLYKITYKQRFLLIIFYLIVCLPFLIYFIGILMGSMSMNSTIVKHITISSEVQNRKSYQKFVYLLTREIAYYEPLLVGVIPDCNQFIMQMVNEAYDRDRTIQNMIMSQPTSINLQNKLSQLNHNNLCQQLSQFPSTSIYYNITFSLQQCTNLGNDVMSQGYKQLIVALYESALELSNNYTNPVNLTSSQRVQFLSQNQLQIMKTILAYSEQFIEQMVTASQSDTQFQIQNLRNTVVLFSLISIFSLILLLIVVRYRYAKLKLQRRQVQSIISLISIQTITNSLNLDKKQQKNQIQSNQLIKMVQKIDWKFYQ